MPLHRKIKNCCFSFLINCHDRNRPGSLLNIKFFFSTLAGGIHFPIHLPCVINFGWIVREAIIISSNFRYCLIFSGYRRPFFRHYINYKSWKIARLEQAQPETWLRKVFLRMEHLEIHVGGKTAHCVQSHCKISSLVEQPFILSFSRSHVQPFINDAPLSESLPLWGYETRLITRPAI